MKITKIEIQKGRPRRRTLYVDGKFFAGVDGEVVERLGLEEDQEIEGGSLAEILQQEEIRRAKEYGLNLLSYRMRSVEEMRMRLTEKGFNGEVVDSVIGDLKRVELLDDQKFAMAWMRSQMETNPKGSYGLKMELGEKKVPEEIVQEVLKVYSKEYDEREVAITLARKRMKAFGKEKEEVIQSRLADFLSRRGFSYEIIREVVHQVYHLMEEGK